MIACLWVAGRDHSLLHYNLVKPAICTALNTETVWAKLAICICQKLFGSLVLCSAPLNKSCHALILSVFRLMQLHDNAGQSSHQLPGRLLLDSSAHAAADSDTQLSHPEPVISGGTTWQSQLARPWVSLESLKPEPRIAADLLDMISPPEIETLLLLLHCHMQAFALTPCDGTT